uniref:C-type lectin domain-containing protein n=1 Tax=Sander lucioperca TaxID=283035 RepID=A0A8C9Z192_SANLU
MVRPLWKITVDLESSIVISLVVRDQGSVSGRRFNKLSVTLMSELIYPEMGNSEFSVSEQHESCHRCGMDGEASTLLCALFSGPDVTFILTDISMTWPAAQSYCREQYTDLASVRNSTENQKVQKLIPTGESVWIGLFRDSWKWLDGSTSLFRYWKTGEPNNNDGTEICVAAAFNQSGQWEDWNCGVKRAFICFGPGEC